MLTLEIIFLTNIGSQMFMVPQMIMSVVVMKWSEEKIQPGRFILYGTIPIWAVLKDGVQVKLITILVKDQKKKI